MVLSREVARRRNNYSEPTGQRAVNNGNILSAHKGHGNKRKGKCRLSKVLEFLTYGILLICAAVSLSYWPLFQTPKQSHSISGMEGKIDESFGNSKPKTATAFERKVVKTTTVEKDADKREKAVEKEDLGEYAGLWHNRLDLVHVVYTRFMQHQPNLLELGKARLQLFKTFCLHTIAHQTSDEFLWIIRTDPELHPELKEGLIQAVVGQNITNVIIVGSNEIRKGSVNGGFRAPESISDITPDSVLYGNIKFAKAYHMVGQTRNVLETNLDADDGLGLTFVENVQNRTVNKFARAWKKEAFFNFCVGRHIEWQYHSPWNANTDKGAIKFGDFSICITPGLSWASQPNAKPEFTTGHHLIKKEAPDCKKHQVRWTFACWDPVPMQHNSDFMAIRARTPTSTGMNKVFMGNEAEWDKEEMLFDKKNWAAVEQFFGIPLQSIQQSHKYLGDHLSDVIAENLKGQCTKDHSCSEGIKKKLKTMLYRNDKWKNEHDIVHVIQTSLDSLLSIDLLIDFSFQSMEAQTTYEFLWIIRIMDFPDANDATEKLMESGIKKSPLNILVVKSDQDASMSFRNPQSIRDISSQTLLLGDLMLLNNYHDAAQNRTVLETNLEPTDAVVKTFAAEMQKSTLVQLNEVEVQDDNNVWYYRCGSDYFEWSYFSPNGFDTEHGFFKISKQQKCMSNPAITRVSRPGANIPYFNEETKISECQVLVVLRIQSGCFAPMTQNETMTTRALVPESVVKPEPLQLAAEELERLIEQDEQLSSVVRNWFNVLPASTLAMKKHIQEQKCETCRPQWNSEYGVVHVMYTSLQDSKLFHIWRRFCITLHDQTNLKFLWIIRVASNQKLIEQVLGPITNIPMNVIVVKSESTPLEGFRRPEAISDINNETLLYGDMIMLNHFQQSSQFRPLLETFLEPTDALEKTFSEDLQSSTSAKFKEEHQHGKDAWYYQCVSNYIEWNDLTPRGDEHKRGEGFLKYGGGNAGRCMERPGTTRVSFPESEVPSGEQVLEAKPCSSEEVGNGCFVTIEGDHSARVLFPKLSKKKSEPIQIDDAQYDRLESVHDSLLRKLRHEFGIFPIALQGMRLKLHGTLAPGGPDTTWKNDRNIVHIVSSRFMQQQASLPTLGNARLGIFKALCLPTLVHQTNKQFLWIIRTAPDLDTQIMDQLLGSLKGHPNIILVGSNSGIDGFHDGSFRDDDTMDEFTNKSVLYGDLNLLKSYHEAAKSHTLLETNLDTDDGVSLIFVESAQRRTSDIFMTDAKKTGWAQLCLGRHLEWHFYAPWERFSDKGCLLIGSSRTCIKSGMSWATQPNAKPNFESHLGMLKFNVPSCTFNRTESERLFEACWEEYQVDDPLMDVISLRSMTPASTGVARGKISSFDWNIKVLTFDKEAWSLLDPYFTVRPESVKVARKYIVDNMKDVVGENARSKCTHEKTCIGLWENKHRVVHVIHSTVRDPNVADLLHRVSLSSLTRQTTYEFMWLIRVVDFSDYRLILALLDPIRKSSFIDQIVLVKSELAGRPLDFRASESIADISEDKILLGDINLVKDYHGASSMHPVLETFLDPTDGLTRTFVEDLQRAVVEDFKKNGVQDGENAYHYRCLSEYMERSYSTPRGDDADKGFLKLIDENGSKCTERPATTRISLPGTKFPDSTDSKSILDSQECSSGSFDNGCFVPMLSAKPLGLRVLLPDAIKDESPVLSEAEIAALEKSQSKFQLQLRMAYSVFPPDITSIRGIMAENTRQVVHVIHTRLHEPLLLRTWRQLASNSIIGQTTKEFIWIIRADYWEEDMIKKVSNPLNFFFKEQKHILFISSNVTSPVDFRLPEAIADITDETIRCGDIDLLRNFHYAARGRTILETFLQPTDAVSTTFSAVMRAATEIELKEHSMRTIQVTENDFPREQRHSWYYRCITEFIEWTYFTPEGKDSTTGFRKLVGNGEKTCAKDVAITRVTLPGAQLPGNGTSVLPTEECSSEANGLKDGCFVNVVSDTTLGVRALLPESTSKPEKDKGLTKATLKHLTNKDKQLSTVLKDSFNISPFVLNLLRTEIQQDECDGGRKCTEKWDSKYKVVHVIQTTIQDPFFGIWRNFAFSVEFQTTKKFLWIIRVAPSESKLLREVLKPINKTPLNIIVVESNYTSTADFRTPEAISDIKNETIKHGNIFLLEHFHKRAQEWPVLETVLEPTDAIVKTFSEDLQKYTAQTNGLPAWHFRCPSDYIEWNYFTPLGKDELAGFLKVVKGENGRCIDRPGTTRISFPGAQISNETSEAKDCSTGADVGCYSPMENGKVVSARVVIPESVEPGTAKVARHKDVIEFDKDKLKKDFGLPPMALKLTRKSVDEMIKEEQEKLKSIKAYEAAAKEP